MDTNSTDKLKFRAQTVIVTISVVLMMGKFLAYYLTRSVGILTDALESIVNVTAGFITLYSIYIASRPKDKDHPFGHGKVELLSASTEGMLIMAAGVMIIYQSISRLIHPEPLQQLDLGIIIVAAAGLVNWIAGAASIRIGKKNNSIALIAGGKHLQSDTYSTIGLVVGLIILYITKIGWIDSALAIIFGTIILVTGIGILRKTITNLMDGADMEILDKMVESVNKERKPDWLDIHNFKTIHYGSALYVDCDLTIPWYYNIIEGHTACDALRDVMSQEFGDRVMVSIHTDPCKQQHCIHCSIKECRHRQHDFKIMLPFTIDNIIYSDEERNAALDND